MSIKLRMQANGLPQLQAAFKKADKDYRGAMAAAVFQKAQETMQASNAITPIDTGDLRGSAYVTIPKGKFVPQSEFGYGIFYAVFVHERTDISHRVGQAKFLRTALNNARAGYTRDIQGRTARFYRIGLTPTGIARFFPTQPRKT